MIIFTLNGKPCTWDGEPGMSLLDHLRNSLHITSAKDGCSGEGTCGACTVEIDGKAKLACRTKMSELNGAVINTTEGLPERFREVIGRNFAVHGAVQCGFCSPGMVMRAKSLFNVNKSPSENEIIKAIKPNLCRCTGYKKIVTAIDAAFRELNGDPANKPEPGVTIGGRYPKTGAERMALGETIYTGDIHIDGMLHVALLFSGRPGDLIKEIDTTAAAASPGVIKVFTAKDIPGSRYTGLINNDWPLMIAEGETTSYVGDVLAAVVAETEQQARNALAGVHVTAHAVHTTHALYAHLPETCTIKTGNIETAFRNAAYISTGTYETQRIEHAFLETETAVALPEDDGIILYSQGQGIWSDRRQVASILALPEEKVRVIQVQAGGGFGGKEDITVQGHAALCAHILKRPVKVHLTRSESIIMHPKRHPVKMEIELACDHNGKFTGLKFNATGDTGAYASVGTKVMERIAGHASGAYVIPNAHITTTTLFTNNIPSGAMRGFGVPQVTFALEGCIDDLCRQGGFDRWQIRYDNALDDGDKTATGQVLHGVGLKKTLLAVKEQFQSAKYAGIACGIKNSGIGNGMTDESSARIEIISPDNVVIHHGWTEMGQGLNTVAIQIVSTETGIDPAKITVTGDTATGTDTGMTTSSRAAVLLGNALLKACRELKNDIKKYGINELRGNNYHANFVCNRTSKPGSDSGETVIHFAYGYATQVAIADDEGRIIKLIAAHDAGQILNRTIFEGQIEGALAMGLGYALTEDLPLKDGMPVSLKLKDCQVPRADDIPELEVMGIEEKDPVGPYGAKGIGEIGLVPTAAAIAGALYARDGIRRFSLPLRRRK